MEWNGGVEYWSGATGWSTGVGVANFLCRPEAVSDNGLVCYCLFNLSPPLFVTDVVSLAWDIRGRP